MLQTLSSAFLAQFQNDEGQALTVVSESIPINDKIEVPFVLDNSVGRKVLTQVLRGSSMNCRPRWTADFYLTWVSIKKGY